nr:glucose-6-phosphate isomerase [uncultured Desulfuromonas sp.]
MISTTRNLNNCQAYARLTALQPISDLSSLLTGERVTAAQVSMGANMWFNYAAKPVDEPILQVLQQLADEQSVVEQYRTLLNGAVMNSSEQRMVLHHLTRGQLADDVIHDGKNLRHFYQKQLERIGAFCRQVHDGELRGSRGDRFTQVCQIGIGGSDLGPRAMYLALAHGADSHGQLAMRAFFISNVDPDDAGQVLSQLDLPSTLFILVSKSGTTQETLTNEALVRDALRDAGLDPAKHMVAVTSETSPLAQSKGFLTSFFMDDFVGGRFSSTSAVGAVVLMLAFGEETVQQFLAGAHDQDRLALNPNIKDNPALLDALIGVYERNVLGFSATAVLPYSQALSRFPAHLQQLDMESNGKSVNRQGAALGYATGPVVFGEPGTNGQHSFYQLLHQGTDRVPLQFIGFTQQQGTNDNVVQGSTSQQKLNANLVAQIVAFAKGRSHDDPNKVFIGQRPSSLIYAPRLTPWVLGSLLAHFENKVMFQGFLWNINSFDQEGVQLGKLLTQQVLGDRIEDAALKAYWQLF